jgi:hypothetical protein
MKWILVLLVLAAFAGLASTAQATPYWSPEQIRAMAPRNTVSSGPQMFLEWEPGRYDYTVEFDRVVDFITALQVLDPEHPSYGGLREAEHMLNVIQTDNTSELIWVLSRYRELTGDTQYDSNIQAAWVYEMNFPAYDEEGGSSNTIGYYRVYNCGWALRAEMKYREVFGDTTFTAYADSCAGYLATHNLVLTLDPTYQVINSNVLGWAAGNLYTYGTSRGNPAFVDKGIARGNRVRGWVNADPTLAGQEAWAMSGGALMWGVLNSYYQAYPESTQLWAQTIAPNMDTYSDPGQFQNAWNGWYALGHLAAGQALNDPAYLANHHALTDTLLFEDGDDDGGIPAVPADPDSMDHAWIANYQAFMGLNAFLAITDVAWRPTKPALNLILDGNWPNPFNPNTVITFTITEPQEVLLQVFNAEGRLIRTLLDERCVEGQRAVPWDGRDAGGRSVAPGVYFYRLHSGVRAESGKMVLVQ